MKINAPNKKEAVYLLIKDSRNYFSYAPLYKEDNDIDEDEFYMFAEELVSEGHAVKRQISYAQGRGTKQEIFGWKYRGI